MPEQYQCVVCRKLQVQKAPLQEDYKFDPNGVFGTQFAPHMLTADWTKEAGWEAPKIQPFGDLQLHPASSSLHYGLQAFEGSKAYLGVDGKIRLFRPYEHMERFALSLMRLTMPAINPAESLALIMELIKVDANYVPDAPDCSMYIRPLMIGTDPFLGVRPPAKCKFVTMCSPCGVYFAGGVKPVSLKVNTDYVRAWEGSAGAAKVGGNYAAVMKPSKEVQEQGYSQPLCLCGGSNCVSIYVKMIVSATGSNIFKNH